MTPAVRHHTLRIRAATGQPMLTCFLDAKRHVHFVATLSADVKAFKKRSKAAKKAWKVRKAKA